MDENDERDNNNEQEAVLIEQINNERRKIVELLANPLGELNKLGVFEKYYIADKALLELLAQPEGREEFFNHDPLPLLDQLQAEVEILDEELRISIEQSKLKEKEKNRLKNSIKELQGLMKNATIDEPITENNLAKYKENIMKRFKFEKVRLKQVLSTIYPIDVEIRDLISKLVEEGIKNPGVYVTADERDGTSERIGMIVKTNLFELNPKNPQQLRMVELT